MAAGGASGSDVGPQKFYRERLLDGEEEVLTEKEKLEKDEILKELTRRLSGPLADEHGNVPTGNDRPIAIEVDGPSHFYANSNRYTAYTKLKHRLLTRMGYKVLHVPYFEWRKLRGAQEREEYMRKKLQEEPTEWLDPEDEKYYTQPPGDEEEETSFKPEAHSPAAPATPPPPHTSDAARGRSQAEQSPAPPSQAPGPSPPPSPGFRPPPRPPGPSAAAPAGPAGPARGAPPLPPMPPAPPARPPILQGPAAGDGQARGAPAPPPPSPRPTAPPAGAAGGRAPPAPPPPPRSRSG